VSLLQRKSFRIAFALLICLGALYVSRSLWLSALGRALVHDEGPVKADIVVLLGGDPWGDRLTRAAALVRDGYAPAILVSGPPGMYESNEADLAIHFALAHGYPAEWFVPLRHGALSTRQESVIVLAYLRAHNLHSFLLVTSDFHTARARRIFLSAIAASQAAGHTAPVFHTVAAPDRYFTPTTWWHSREGSKTTFFEWSKTIATALGI
jgi:uncharacterized SAM-binding protein YcdF (DUF218 family)